MPGDGQYFPLKDPIFRDRSIRQFQTACSVSVARHARLNTPSLLEPSAPGRTTLVTRATQLCGKEASPACASGVEDAMLVDEAPASVCREETLAIHAEVRSSAKRPLPSDMDDESQDVRRVKMREAIEAAIPIVLSTAAGRLARPVHQPRQCLLVSNRTTIAPREAGHQRILLTACRTPASQSAHQNYLQTMQLQGGIKPSEMKSLVPLGCAVDQSREAMAEYVLYTLPLRLCPERTQHWDLLPFGGSYYFVAIDSADAGFWFFGENFARIPDGSDGPVKDFDNWPDTEDDPMQRHKDRGVIPQGTPEQYADSTLHGYVDGGSLCLTRWSDLDLPFCAPSWDWRENKEDNNTTYLAFPRVLATATCDRLAYQVTDGNLGLAVPGHRSPWTGVRASDRLTFFDILKSSTSTVETPSQLTIRLLAPDLQNEYGVAGRTRSHLYYGRGSPCGVLFDDKIYVPQFSPRLEVLRNPALENCHDQWRLELMSMTLLKPNKLDPRHDSLEETDWTPITINMTGTSTYKHAGIQVILDTGAACSVLPDPILDKMSQAWFDVNPDEHRDQTALVHQIDFSNHDILFDFRDANGQAFTLRCNARDFLTSPWTREIRRHPEPESNGAREEAGATLQADLDLEESSNTEDLFDAIINDMFGTEAFFNTATNGSFDTHTTPEPDDIPARSNVSHTYHLTQFVRQGQLPYASCKQWILGINFFWVALVKLSTDDPSCVTPNGPNIQLAPQRVLLDGKVLGGPRDLKIPFDLPPRLQAVFREQPELAD